MSLPSTPCLILVRTPNFPAATTDRDLEGRNLVSVVQALGSRKAPPCFSGPCSRELGQILPSLKALPPWEPVSCSGVLSVSTQDTADRTRPQDLGGLVPCCYSKKLRPTAQSASLRPQTAQGEFQDSHVRHFILRDMGVAGLHTQGCGRTQGI